MIENAASFAGSLLYISERVRLSFACSGHRLQRAGEDVSHILYGELAGFLVCTLAIVNLEYHHSRPLGLRLLLAREPLKVLKE